MGTARDTTASAAGANVTTPQGGKRTVEAPSARAVQDKEVANPGFNPVYAYQEIATPATHRSPKSTDICTSWQVIGAPIRLSTCSYSSGGSGYYVVENNSGAIAEVCWSVRFNAGGKPSDGCYSHMPSGTVSSGSCFSCGRKNGGAKSIELRTFKSR